MKLVNAVSKIAELPLILERYGISTEDVLKAEYSAGAADIDVSVLLCSIESIKKLGDYETDRFIGYKGEQCVQYKLNKYGISFACCKCEEAI